MQTGPGDRPVRKVKPPKVKPRVVKAPAGDVASSGGDYGMRQAKRAEKSPAVKRAQQAVYSAQPVARRKQILANAQGSVKANIQPVHDRAIARNRALAVAAAGKDTKGDTDRARAQAFLVAHPEILKPKKSEKGGSVIGTITGAAKIVPAGVKIGRDLAGTIAPWVAAAALPSLGASTVASGNRGRFAAKLVSNGGRDLVDIPANTIPSLYGVAKLATESRVAEAGGQHSSAQQSSMKAAKILAQPYIDTAKDPLKSFVDHPVGTALLASGVKGGAGRGVGKALRVAPSKTLRRIGSTERAPIQGPGNIAANKAHPYSKDIINKGAQVAAEKVKARRARKKGQPAPVRTMSERDIQKRVDADVAASRSVAAHNEAKAQKKAKKALGRKPTAATSAVAQGIADGSKADLQALVAEYRAKAAGLTGASLKRNQQTVALLEDALKKHDPVKVTAAAQAYSDMRAPGEAETIARGFVKPDVAESTRLAGVAVRRHDVQTGAEAPKVAKQTAKDARKIAAQDLRKAKRKAAGPDAKVVTQAKVNLGQQITRARGNAARRRSTIVSGDIGKSLGATRAQRVTAYIKAVEDGDRPTMLRLARQESADRAAVKTARVSVKTAKVAQRQGPKAARSAAEAARRAHVDVKAGLKQGAYVGPNGKLIPLPVVRGSTGPIDPVYVSHSPGGDVRPAAVPTEPPTLAVKEARSGKAIAEGTINLHPDQLIKQAGDSQRRLDASKNYQRFLDDFSHRKSKGASPETYGNSGTAEQATRALKDSTGVDWVAARTFDGNYQLVPKAAATRLAQHAQHNDNLMGAFTRQWSKNVLAFSPRWLAGQLIEPGVRAGVAHAGPRSVVTSVKAVRGIKKVHGQDAVDLFKAHTMSSGLQQVAMRPLEHVGAQKEYAGLAKVMHDLPKKPGPKHLGLVYNAVTNFTLGTLNHIAQTPSQYAMLGKAIRDSDLMTAHTVKLSNAAIDDFVRNGGTDVNVMAQLGREVTRMNGKYNGFSPKVQAGIAGYTPFLAWTLNATNFLFHVMPRDHPVLTSLIASANQATESWRKANGLYLDPFNGSVEGWLQGSVPGKDGSHLRLGRYLPVGLGNDDTPFLGPYADSILPQLSGVIAAVKGVDFTNTRLTGPHGPAPSLVRKAEAAGASLGKGVVPLASQILNVAGVHTPDNADSRKVKPTVGARARSQFDPFMYTPGRAGGGSSSAPPVGVSKAELDRLVSEAAKQQQGPGISDKELQKLLKEQSGR